MKILIIEDEEHNSRMLQEMLQKIRPKWKTIETTKSVEKTLKWFSENKKPDLIFSDIQLSDGLCFSIFNQIKIHSMIVFTTAYEEYAIQAFDVNSIDYLLKPIKEKKLKKTIEKFENLYEYKNPKYNIQNYNELMTIISKGEKKYRTKILVNDTKTFYKINVENVAFCYTEHKITFAVTFDNKKHIINFSIENLEQQLNPEHFFRANRSIIINTNAIHNFENYSGNKLFLRLIKPFKKEIIISRLKASEFKIWMGK